ncbi:MAG TPA: response regulator [Phycisphaerae bacterium]|nr:response regulator [Phycisphaerae bacterium]
MKKALSTSVVARMLGVAVGSVSKWIDDGRLKAARTPGGHRRVAHGDLLDFLRRLNWPIPPELAHAGPRILVADDEEAVARWLADSIRRARPDAEVLLAHDGFAAGEIVVSSTPDVVILDLRMPGVDGFEVCRRIKAREETRHAAVIAVTAYASDDAEQRILECGARALLTKPLRMEDLLAELDAVFGPARRPL